MKQKKPLSRHRQHAVTLEDDPFAGPVDMGTLTGTMVAIAAGSVQRHAALAEHMAAQGQRPIAAAFEALHAQATEALANLHQWAGSVGHPVEDIAVVAGKRPRDLDRIWDELIDSALISPYRVFAAAVRNRQRVAELLSYMAAEAVNEDVRIQAEKLAVKALTDASGIRHWRRTAWHQERDQVEPAGSPRIRSLPELETFLARQWRHIHACHRAISQKLRDLSQPELADALLQLVPDQEGSPGSECDTTADLASADTAASLLAAAQRPVEQLIETLDIALTTCQDELFDASVHAMEQAVTVLSAIGQHAEGEAGHND